MSKPLGSLVVSAWGEFLATVALAQATFGDQAMKNEQLPLLLDVNAFLGVTDWMNGQSHPPRRVGWYDTRLAMTDEERASREKQTGRPLPIMRRWWDGECFSMPVAADDEAETAIRLMDIPAIRRAVTIEWRGATGPANKGLGKSVYPDTD